MVSILFYTDNHWIVIRCSYEFNWWFMGKYMIQRTEMGFILNQTVNK